MHFNSKEADNATQIYFPEESKALFQAIEEALIKEPNNTALYAIMLNFYMGLRISELAALKWIDIEEEYLHIQRMERKVSSLSPDNKFTTPKRVIEEHVKTNNEDGNRLIYLIEPAREIIEHVKQINLENPFLEKEFIFCSIKGRITIRQISYYLEKLCKKAGIPLKSSHDIRRTYASILNAGNVPLDEIRRILGHTSEKTTLGYLYNPYGQTETNQLIEQALK